MSQKFDVIIVGGGPGGYVAAIRARQLNLSVALVEQEHLGGVCLNWGCIPTKSLLKSAEVYELLKHAHEFGIETTPAKIDLKAVVDRSRKVSGQLSSGIQHLLKKNKVTIFEGKGRLKGPNRLLVNNQEELEAPHIIFATGARARGLIDLPVDEKDIWSARQAMTPEVLPKSLLVIGSGAIGIEFASFYRTLGVDVTVVELQDRILPQEDEEISAEAFSEFQRQGISFHLETRASSYKKEGDGLKVKLETGGASPKMYEITVEKILVAVGVTGNIEDLGLEEAGVKTDRGHIVIDQWGQTSVAGIYAIGDVAGPPWLAHKASHEGIACIEKIAGLAEAHPLKKGNIPGCTYSLPQIASVGMTEAQAKAQGKTFKIGRFPFKGNGKAFVIGKSQGFVKLIFEEGSGELLGAHMIGPDVSELIHSLTVAKTLEATELELFQTIFPHPTLSESIHEAALDAYGRVIHF